MISHITYNPDALDLPIISYKILMPQILPLYDFWMVQSGFIFQKLIKIISYLFFIKFHILGSFILTVIIKTLIDLQLPLMTSNLPCVDKCVSK